MDDAILRCGSLVVTTAVTEVQLAQAYIRMLEEGTLSTVFYQASPTLRDFLTEYLSQGRRICFGCFRDIKSQPIEFCGLAWVFNAVKMDGFTKAEVGIVLFKRQSVKTDNLKFGQMILRMFFEKHAIDAVYGCTPEGNKLALRYAQKLGFGLTTPIPGYSTWQGQLCAGVISYMLKSDWLERNR
jgi:RimJ/RimL family protein N-acetyltransferase